MKYLKYLQKKQVMKLPGINSQIFEIQVSQDWLPERELKYFKMSSPEPKGDGWEYKLYPVDKPNNIENVITITIENEENKS